MNAAGCHAFFGPTIEWQLVGDAGLARWLCHADNIGRAVPSEPDATVTSWSIGCVAQRNAVAHFYRRTRGNAWVPAAGVARGSRCWWWLGARRSPYLRSLPLYASIHPYALSPSIRAYPACSLPLYVPMPAVFPYPEPFLLIREPCRCLVLGAGVVCSLFRGLVAATVSGWVAAGSVVLRVERRECCCYVSCRGLQCGSSLGWVC
jgi:hypothetical protein